MPHLSPASFKKQTERHYGLRGDWPGRIRLGPRNGPFKYVYDRWEMFDRWHAWKDRGGQRPKGVWKKVPQWEPDFSPWDLRKAILAKRTHDPLPNPAPTPGPPPFSLAPAQSWICLAQSIGDADHAKPYYKFAYVADRAYERPSLADVQRRRAQGRVQAAWCDCREDGTGTPPSAAIDMANELGLDTWIGQA